MAVRAAFQQNIIQFVMTKLTKNYFILLLPYFSHEIKMLMVNRQPNPKRFVITFDITGGAYLSRKTVNNFDMPDVTCKYLRNRQRSGVPNFGQ